jgi:hypothetical protein
MRNLLRSLTICFVLAATPMAFADRQGGGGLLVTSGRVSIDKWIDFDARLVAVVVPDLNLALDSANPVSEFVRFKSANRDQVTFDYTWIKGAQASSGQLTVDKTHLTKEGAEVVKALLESKRFSGWSVVETHNGGSVR